MALTTIRVVIADDHEVLRHGLRRVLEATTDIVVVGEANNGHAAVAMVAKIACDVLLLDVAMPDKTGIEVAKIVHQAQPKLPILMLSMHLASQYAVRCLKAGVAGYLNKQATSLELVQAIRLVAKGRKYINAELSQILAEHVNDAEHVVVHELLSDREYQTLTLLGEGLTVTEIAHKLALSAKTISAYRARLLVKMQLKNNADLMHYAIENKLGYTAGGGGALLTQLPVKLQAAYPEFCGES